eukprot:9382577-Lingulodinium_polyedra.AAC.1
MFRIVVQVKRLLHPACVYVGIWPARQVQVQLVHPAAWELGFRRWGYWCLRKKRSTDHTSSDRISPSSMLAPKAR